MDQGPSGPRGQAPVLTRNLANARRLDRAIRTSLHPLLYLTRTFPPRIRTLRRVLPPKGFKAPYLKAGLGSRAVLVDARMEEMKLSRIPGRDRQGGLIEAGLGARLSSLAGIAINC